MGGAHTLTHLPHLIRVSELMLPHGGPFEGPSVGRFLRVLHTGSVVLRSGNHPPIPAQALSRAVGYNHLLS